MENLPSDIYLDLLSWLKNDDQVAFAMINLAICVQLIKKVRVLWMFPPLVVNRNFERKFRSYLTSKELQNLIVDPYHQLLLFVPHKLDLKVAGFDDISISCKSLSITVDQLTTSFIHCIKKVQSLTLGFSGFGRPSLTDSEVQLIADWINNSDLGLKELTIDNYDITNLPVISNLESLAVICSSVSSLSGLNISAYSNLHCLKLSSLSIEDISSLDGIHELQLLYCHAIRDISCLNHNYKIVVKECKGILDYSNSFRYSKVIHISCPSNIFMLQPIRSCDLTKALEAREIYFEANDCEVPVLLPCCFNLRSVTAKYFKGRFILPPQHHIREIIVKDYTDLPSLLHFDRIYSVKLVDLNISSLEGLGSGNRVVEVDTCPLITDFSPLIHCDKVTILNCKGFQDVNQVRGVKELIFSPADQFPKDMEGVTCLILVRVPDGLLPLMFPSTLKKLIIPFRFQTVSARADLIKCLPSFLTQIPRHVEKIEVFVSDDYFRSLLKKDEVSFSDFIIEFKKGTHFLRKPKAMV